ncbi:PREDICTED: sister chromatid cohesion protein PDS5 homolog B-like isoform X2 [Eufriesea mexicana]|nr:PREDICTED: sister chromatid cohesion protein PDS5 homolog B-like isoform X2 [Eufriesea mexicana]
MNVIYTKTTNFDMKEFPSETRIPTMYFKRADELLTNTRNYLPAEMQINMTSPKGKVSLHNTHSVSDRPQRRAKSKQQKEVGIGPNETDARPAEASETRIQLPGLEEEIEEPPAKRALRESDKVNK